PAGGHRPGQRALGIMTIAGHLTVGQFARRPTILPRHPDRVSPLLLKASIIKNEPAVPFTWNPLHPSDPLPVEAGLIPDHVGQPMRELVLLGLGHDLRQG